MGLLAASAAAMLVGAIILGFLAMRLAMKVAWKLAMLGLGLGLLALAAALAYWVLALGGTLPLGLPEALGAT